MTLLQSEYDTHTQRQRAGYNPALLRRVEKRRKSEKAEAARQAILAAREAERKAIREARRAAQYQPKNYDAHVIAYHIFRIAENEARRTTQAHNAVSAMLLKDAFYSVCPYLPSEIEGDNRRKDVVKWRMALMHLLYTQTGMSTPQIGKAVGGRDHTTVLHGVNSVKAAIEAGNATTVEIADGHKVYLRGKS